MTEALQALATHAREVFAEAIVAESIEHGELSLTVRRDQLRKLAKRLRDDNMFRFEQLMDVCGVDYLTYRAEAPEGAKPGPRFAVVYHLLSISRNQRLRLRVHLDDQLPVVDSVNDLWPSANWFEREAFDMFGIVFEGHPDLRRILMPDDYTDHPLRKELPLFRS